MHDDLRHRADAVHQRLHIDLPGWYAAPADTPFLPPVANAVWRRARLHVRYRRWRAPREVERTLDPVGLVLKSGRWYLVARADGQFRTYRVSELLEARSTGEHFDRPDGFDLAAYWQAYLDDFALRRHPKRARVRLSPRALDRLDHVVEPTVVPAVTASVGEPDADGWVAATIPIESIAHAHDQLLRLGADIEVLAPTALRNRLARTAVELARCYSAAATRSSAGRNARHGPTSSR